MGLEQNIEGSDTNNDDKKVIVIREGTHVEPGVGFVEGNPNNFVAIGPAEQIIQGLRDRGWSEEALAAFKRGESISRNVTTTPIGRVGHDEKWKGKDEG